MQRREAVQYISLLLGGTLIGANAFLTGCKTKNEVSYTFTDEDIAFLNEVGETILPATATPGALSGRYSRTAMSPLGPGTDKSQT